MPDIEDFPKKSRAPLRDTNGEWQKQDLNVFRYYDQLRKRFRDLNSAIVQRTFGEYLEPESNRIIEIGGGDGELARLISPENKLGMISSDINPGFASLIKKNHPEIEVVSAEARKLPFKDGSADVVTGYSVFDILPSLEGSAREAARILKTEGKFIHFMDTANDDFYHNDLLPKSILVFQNPLKEREKERPGDISCKFPFATASKEEVREAIKEKKRPKWLLDAIVRYIENPELEFLHMSQDRRKVILSDMTRFLSGEGVSLVPLDYSEMFQRGAREIFEQNGFKILKNGLESEKRLIKDTRLLFKRNNFIQQRVEKRVDGKRDDIPKGMMMLESVLHVFVAEKRA